MSTTKYGKYTSPSLKWTSKTGVDMSRHARARWDERTPADAVSPEHAWEHGITVPASFYGVFRGDKYGQDPDEVRTFREDENAVSKRYQASLVMRNGTIVTVLMTRKMTSPERAYLKELWFSRGGQ